MTSVQTQNMQNISTPYNGVQAPAANVVQTNSTAPAPSYVPAYPNICYPPQYYCGMPMCTSGCPAVEININNPMTHSGPMYMPQTSNYPQQVCGTPMPVQQQVAQVPQQSVQQTPVPQQQPQNQTKPAAAAPIKKEEPKKDIVPLTDDYIRSLENYLNHPNPDVRLVAVKELSARFKEDNSRRNDQALTNLLNKSLRDPSQKVRLIALGILDGNTAEGDKLTYKILQDMQRSNSNYNQDSVTAAEIMLRKSGRKFAPPNNSNNTSAKETKSEKGQKLNVTAG